MRRAAALFLLILALLTAGCWDLHEVEEQAYVTGIGVDKAPGSKIKLLFQVINPRALGGGARGVITPGVSISAKGFRNYEAVGRTVLEAAEAISLAVPLNLHLAHNREIIFSEKVARGGLLDVMSFFNRRVDMRKLTYPMVTRDKIEVVLDVPNPLETVPSLRIEAIMRQQGRKGYFPAIRLGRFIDIMTEKGRETYCPVVRVKRNPTQSLTPYKSSLTAPEPYLDIEIAGTALFKKDKLVGFLNKEETRGFLWTQGQVQGGPLLIRCPKEGKYVTLRVLRSKAKIKPEITSDGRLKVTVEIREEANLEEIECHLNVAQVDVIKQLEAMQAKVITQEVMSAVRKAKECKSDVFGFGSAFHRRYPKQWREMEKFWAEQLFPQVEVKVVADARIRRTGLRKMPLTLTPKLEK